jgi:predicted MFS family arabinose efflux permease
MFSDDKNNVEKTLNNLSAAGFFISTQQQMINPVIGLYANEVLQVQPALVGYIFTFFSFSSLLIKLGSYFIVKWRRIVYPLFVPGLLISVLAPLGYVLARNYALLLALRIVHGAAFAFDTVLMLTIAGHRSDGTSLLKAIQRYTTFLAVGLTTGPIIGTFTVSLLGVGNTIMLSSLMGVGAFFTGFKTAKTVLADNSVIDTEKTGGKTASQLKDRVLAITSFGYLSYNISYGGVLAFSPLIARRELGFSESLVTIMFLIYYMSALLARASLSRLLKRLKAETIYEVILLASAIGVVFIALLRDPFIFASGYVLMAMAHGLSFPLSSLIVAQHFKNDQVRLTANSVLMSMWDTGMMLGPLICSVFLSFLPLNQVLVPLVMFPLAGCLIMALTPFSIDKESRIR